MSAVSEKSGEETEKTMSIDTWPPRLGAVVVYKGMPAEVVFRWMPGEEKPRDPVPDFAKGQIYIHVVSHDDWCPQADDPIKGCRCDPEIIIVRIL